MKKLRHREHACCLARESGAAMVVVLCVMALFMALALTMLFSAASITGNARITAVNKRCQIAATSLNEALRQEITKTQEQNNNPIQTIQDYMRYNIDGQLNTPSGAPGDTPPENPEPRWNYCIEDVDTSTPEVHTVYFADLKNLPGMESLVDEKYDLRIEFYWMMDAKSTYITGKNEGRKWELFGCDGSKMVVTCICSRGDEAYKVRTVYQLSCINTSENIYTEGDDATGGFNAIDNNKLIDKDMTWKNFKWIWNPIWTE